MQALKLVRRISPLLIAVLGVGCDRQHDSEPPEPATALMAAPDSTPSRAGQEALAILAKADSFDGAEDMIVSKCLTCSLGMAGDAEHVSTFASYELHLCSETCKESFDAEPEKAILAAAVPASLE